MGHMKPGIRPQGETTNKTSSGIEPNPIQLEDSVISLRLIRFDTYPYLATGNAKTTIEILLATLRLVWQDSNTRYSHIEAQSALFFNRYIE